MRSLGCRLVRVKYLFDTFNVVVLAANDPKRKIFDNPFRYMSMGHVSRQNLVKVDCWKVDKIIISSAIANKKNPTARTRVSSPPSCVY